MIKLSYRSSELLNRLTKSIWWAPAESRSGDSTGVAHAIHHGSALCGARPYTMGSSVEFAIQAGCRECIRCRSIIKKVELHD